MRRESPHENAALERPLDAWHEAAGGPPPLGTHILMRDNAPQKIANAVAKIESGTIAPVELVCRAG